MDHIFSICIFFMYADDTNIYFSLEDSFDSNNLEIEMNAELHKVSIVYG